jgi:hypothetical protein
MSRSINTSRTLLPRREVRPGTFCLAPFTDETGARTYYRARIRAVNPVGDVLVYFVDYGNSDWVQVSLLQTFSSVHVQYEIVTTPAMAIECRLGEIKPSILHNSVWQEEAISNFRSFVNKAPSLRINVIQFYQIVFTKEQG